tara:strand:- start:1654 stop:1884 length:231 start_codon:yes stop_codon:yes gene_type:complete
MYISKKGWILVNANNERVVEKELVTTKDGENWIVEGGVPPHKPSSTGRVWVSLLSNPKHNRDFFPTVFNLKWQEIA